ncbi:hypothetical protein [Paenibacillus herberti]|uniref:Histidine kinase n=1 Tax=Paenibacillus herberti TaxID=1619309 RepID=A0A229P252_9BACL|nr:hypothetical protein [Paenibacillus herberti]OXM16180.1 hypothetical protein CGZ75_05645 [Paenibacillus herberti]
MNIDDQILTPSLPDSQKPAELHPALSQLSEKVEADAYYIAIRVEEGDQIDLLHHRGEPILHCGMMLPRSTEEENGKLLQYFNYQVPMSKEKDGTTAILGILRKETSFSEEEKSRLASAAASWNLSDSSSSSADLSVQEQAATGFSTGLKPQRAEQLRGEQLRLLGLEMMNALTNIDGMAELLADSPLEVYQLDMLEELRQNNSHLASLVQTLVKHSVLLDGSWERFSGYPFSVVQLSNRLLQEHAAAEMSGRLVCWISEDVPEAVLGSKEELVQLLNLLLKLAESGGPGGSIRLNIHMNSRNTGDGLMDLLVQLILEEAAAPNVRIAEFLEQAREMVENNGGELWQEPHSTGWSLQLTFQVKAVSQ